VSGTVHQGADPDPIRQSLWFGRPDRRLFGWLHVPPSGEAGAGVVLCPSLSSEAARTAPALRRLADLLAGAGLAAFRFDYDGTGDSSGSDDDPGRVAAWIGSVSQAVVFVRSLGLRAAVVGLRMGGTLAAAALDDISPPVDQLVLWDPCPSGRAFLRQQQMLAAAALHHTPRKDGSIETLGMVFAPETVTALRELHIDHTKGPLAEAVLVLTRRGRPVDPAMAARLSEEHVTWDVVDGQDTLVDEAPNDPRTPEDTLERIAAWMAAGPAAPAVLVPRDHDDRAVVGTDVDGRPIVERPVTLAGGQIFAMVTRPGCAGIAETRAEGSGGGSGADQAEPARPGPVVVFLNAGVIDHAGPSRLWVAWSRRWAALGLRCVRVDLRGNGESSPVVGWSGPPFLSPTVTADIDAVLSDVTGGNPSDAVLVGLCSGGFHALHAARRQHVRAVCAINPVFSMSPGENDQPGSYDSFQSDYGPVGTHSRARHLPFHDTLSRAVERLPSSAWWILNRIAVADAPAPTVITTTKRGTLVFVAVNGPDARMLRRGGALALRRAQRRELLALHVIDDLDHTLFGEACRDQVTALLTTFLATRWTAHTG